MKNKMSVQNSNAKVGRNAQVAHATEVSHIHQGGQDSFKTLVRNQIPTLRRYAMALRGPISDHDEIVRDTIEQAIKIKNTYSSDENIGIWLLSILHDVYSTQYGNRMPTSSVIPLDIAFDVSSDSAIYGKNASNQNDGDLDITDIEYALALLPENHKEAFLLVSLEGLSYKQVSGILDIPVGTLMLQLTQARKLIKAIVTANH